MVCLLKHIILTITYNMSGYNKSIWILWNTTGGHSKNLFLSDILKLRFFSVRFKGCFVAPRRSSCSSVLVTCQRDACLACRIVIILWATRATRRFTEMLNLTPCVMSGEICYEKVVACCRCVLQTHRNSWIPLLFDLTEGLQNSMRDVLLIRKIRPACMHALSPLHVCFS